MSAVAPSAVAPPPAELRETTFVKRPQRSLRPSRAAIEPLALFGCAFAAYLVLGWQITLERHAIPEDGISRLAHAFFVFYNAPHKLAAIGFVWPPLETMVFLPLAAIKPLATSLWALPLTTAVFGAALLVALAGWLREAGMPTWRRLALVVLLGINPMIACYASNGMGEVISLWLLTTSIVAYVRWHQERNVRQLIIAGVSLAIGSLVRYEIALWALVLVPAIVFREPRRRGFRVEAEASAITLLAPVVYALGLWSFLNWTIIGHPLSWLRSESTVTFAETSGAAGHITILDSLREAASVHLRLFPLTFVVAAALVLVAVRRRSSVGAILAAALLLNAAATAALALKTQAPNVFQLRYNMRAIPLVLVGVGWLYTQIKSSRSRLAVWSATAVALAATLPLTWHTMATDPNQFREGPFTRALATGRDQQGTRVVGSNDRIAVTQDEAMAHYVVHHVRGRNRILADDAKSFGIMLRSGNPSLFVDRVDLGDADWFRVAAAPYGRVDYVLFSDQRDDLLNRLYPRAYGGRERGLRLVYSTSTSRLYAIVGELRG